MDWSQMFPKMSRFRAIFGNLLAIVMIAYVFYSKKMSNPTYQHEVFVKNILDVDYETIGPARWEDVNLHCMKYVNKKLWSVVRLRQHALTSKNLELYNLKGNMSTNANFLINIPSPGGGRAAFIPRNLMRKTTEFFREGLVFTSWKIFLWDDNLLHAFPFKSHYSRPVCWYLMDEIRIPTTEELEQYKKLYYENGKLPEYLEVIAL